MLMGTTRGGDDQLWSWDDRRRSAARFTQRLKDLIESGYGLDDSTVESEQVAAPGTAKKS